jgi:predicted membrane channel-forming protein YqfA (hemolysin III family)
VQRLRTFTFASSVVLGLAGALQWRFLVKAEARSLFFPKVAGSLAFYGLGFGFCASHWPERRWPGAFDYALHSHQLWHLCVVAAVGVWYYLCLATTTALGTEGCVAFVRVAGPHGSGTAAPYLGDGGVPFGLRASHAR